MVRTYRSRITLPRPWEQVFELLRSPRSFIPLWPFLASYDEERGRVRLQLRRFGFTITVDYDVAVAVDEAGRRVVYTCEAPGRLFVVTASVEPSGGGSVVEIEAAYSGGYESLSEPLLRQFVEDLLAKVRSVAELGAPGPREGLKGVLADPGFVARAMVSGRVVLSERVTLRSEADVASLLRRLAGLSAGGKRVLVRIGAGGLLARILFVDGEPVDALVEAEGRSEHGLHVVEGLLARLRGEASVLAVEI